MIGEPEPGHYVRGFTDRSASFEYSNFDEATGTCPEICRYVRLDASLFEATEMDGTVLRDETYLWEIAEFTLSEPWGWAESGFFEFGWGELPRYALTVTGGLSARLETTLRGERWSLLGKDYVGRVSRTAKIAFDPLGRPVRRSKGSVDQSGLHVMHDATLIRSVTAAVEGRMGALDLGSLGIVGEVSIARSKSRAIVFEAGGRHERPWLGFQLPLLEAQWQTGAPETGECPPDGCAFASVEVFDAGERLFVSVMLSEFRVAPDGSWEPLRSIYGYGEVARSALRRSGLGAAHLDARIPVTIVEGNGETGERTATLRLRVDARGVGLVSHLNQIMRTFDPSSDEPSGYRHHVNALTRAAVASGSIGTWSLGETPTPPNGSISRWIASERGTVW